MNYKYLWIIVGAKEHLESGNFIGGTTIRLYAQTEEEALAKAKILIHKNLYYILEVQEQEDHSEFNEKYLRALEDKGPKRPWEK